MLSALRLLLAWARALAIARLCLAHPVGLAEADEVALALATLGAPVEPTTPVLRVEVAKVEVAEAEVAEAEVSVAEVVKVELVEVELKVRVAVELPTPLFPLTPPASVPLPPVTVF